MTTTSRLGEFAQATLGLFDFNAHDLSPRAGYFGLHLSDTYMMAHLRGGGRQLHVVRPLALETSPGLSFSSEGEDGIYADPLGARFMRGGFLKRGVDANGALTFAGGGGAWSGGSPQSYQASFAARMDWRDSGQLDLTGRLLGPGIQFHIPWRDGDAAGGTYYAGLFYEVEGTLFDEPVSGIVILDHTFSPPGQSLHDSVVRRRYIGAWNAFATVFADGTAQYGQFGYGAGPFKFANLVDRGRHVAAAIAAVTAEYGAGGLGTRLAYQLDQGEIWEFVTGASGTLQDITRAAASQGVNLQVHKGRVAKQSESVPARNWYAMTEWFPDRIANPNDAEMKLPAGL